LDDVFEKLDALRMHQLLERFLPRAMVSFLLQTHTGTESVTTWKTWVLIIH
jgi:hypothetical protein